jgi:hypothetical protein
MLTPQLRSRRKLRPRRNSHKDIIGLARGTCGLVAMVGHICG